MSMSKIKELRVKYEDGAEQVATFDDGDEVSCEYFQPEGSLHNAGEMTRQELATSLAEEILRKHNPHVGPKVCEELSERGIVTFWEHPGYVSIPLKLDEPEDETGWAIGTVNGKWDGQLHDSVGNDVEQHDFDSEIPGDCQDVKRIADAIEKHVRQVAGVDSRFALPPGKFYLVGPDGLHDGQEYPSLAAARAAIADFVKRYEHQGYYSAADGRRIALADLPNHCKASPIPFDDAL